VDGARELNKYRCFVLRKSTENNLLLMAQVEFLRQFSTPLFD
jgi:hypothetical protein